MDYWRKAKNGRDYLEGGQLRYAFKVTLLALHMINCRIKVIEENMDKKEKRSENKNKSGQNVRDVVYY